MMPRYAFLHAAELRLDAPFSGIGRTPPAVAAALRDASLQAWEALVETAIARGVVAVLLAGGLCDGLERGVRAQARLRAGVARLAAHGIAVCLAIGARDPQDGLVAVDHWPEGVTVFGPGEAGAVTLHRDGEPIAVVHGIGVDPESGPDAAARRIVRGDASVLHVALLPCAVGRGGAAVDALRGAGIDYWALGGAPDFAIQHARDPWLVMPGTPQARTPEAHGARRGAGRSGGRRDRPRHARTARPGARAAAVRVDEPTTPPRCCSACARGGGAVRQRLQARPAVRPRCSARARRRRAPGAPAGWACGAAGGAAPESEQVDPLTWWAALRPPPPGPLGAAADDLAGEVARRRALLSADAERTMRFLQRAFDPLRGSWTAALDPRGASTRCSTRRRRWRSMRWWLARKTPGDEGPRLGVDGFGAARPRRQRAADRLTVVYGANEAGKTTCWSSLRRMLFGPAVNGGGPSYTPLAGGPYRAAGCASSGAAPGEYIVRRDLRRPRRSRGDAAGQVRRQRPRPGAPARRRRREAVPRRLRHRPRRPAVARRPRRGRARRRAVLGQSRRRRPLGPRRPQARLRAQAARRLDGAAPARIGDCIAALNALRPRLACRTALDYPQQRRAAGRRPGRRAVGEPGHRPRGAPARRAAAGMAWQALQAARGELAGLADLPARRRRSWRRRWRRRASACRRRAAPSTRCAPSRPTPRRSAPRCASTTAPPPAAPEIDALCGDLTLHRFQLATLPAARARAEAARRRAHAPAAARRGLGRGGVARLGAPGHRSRPGARLAGAPQGRRRARPPGPAARRGGGRHAASLREHVDAATAQLPLRPPLAAEVVEARRRALGELRAAVLMLKKRIEAKRWRRRCSIASRRCAPSTRGARPGTPPPWLAPLLGAAATAARGVVERLHRQRRRAGDGRGGGPRRRRRRPLRRASSPRRGRAPPRARAGAARAAQRARGGAAGARPGLARGGGVGRADRPRQRGPGVAARAGAEAADAAGQQLEAEEAARAQHAAARAQLASLEPALRGAEETAAARAGERDAAETARDALEAEWRAWAARAGVGDATDLELVLDRVTRLQSAHDALLAHDAADRELRQVAPMVAAWESRAGAALARTAGGGLSGDALVERILALRAHLQDQAPQRARRAALEVEVRERGARLAAAVESCPSGPKAPLRCW
ncbi:MAG: AAA family ATPase [Candidatus Binatia bacterium]